MPTFKAIFLTLIACVFAQSANAIPITDTVVVGNKEWAQVDLFNGATWNSINSQCPSGVCGASSIFNSFSLDGWTWATQANVGDFLFGPLTAHPGGVNILFEEPIDNLSPWIAATGFNLTRDDAFGVSTFHFINKEVFGLTSDAAGGVAFASYERVANSGSIRSSRTRFFTNTAIGVDEVAQYNGGAWFYREASTIPEPTTLTLLGLGLAGLGWNRRKRVSEVKRSVVV